MIEPLFQVTPDVKLAQLDASTAAKTYLAVLPSGRQFQLSEQLYQLLSCLEQPRSSTELAEAFEQRTGKVISQSTLQQLIDQVLTPRGLIRSSTDADQSTATTDTYQQQASVLDLHYKKQLFSAQRLAPVTEVLSRLYNPVVASILLGLTTLAHIFSYAQLGLPPTIDISQISMSLALVLLLVGVIAHELGHLAACRYWRCEHGGLGVGLYFFSPVFYVDVTQTWRLSRWQRMVVDLGGIYFQLVFTLLMVAAYWATSTPTYLWIVVFTDLFILFNLNPLIKLDGYWVVADAMGVPNLHRRMGELLRYGFGWLRRNTTSQPPQLSTFGHFTPGTLVAIIGYTIISFDLWVMMLGLVIPVIVQILISLPSEVVEAGRSLSEGIVSMNVGLMLRALEILFVPIIVALNLALILRQLYGSSVEWFARRSKNYGSK